MDRADGIKIEVMVSDDVVPGDTTGGKGPGNAIEQGKVVEHNIAHGDAKVRIARDDRAGDGIGKIAELPIVPRLGVAADSD